MADGTASGRWGGVVPSLVTPFDVHGAVDVQGLRRLVEFCLECGADGLLCTALAGETAALTDAERRTVTTTVLEAAAGRVPVFVGVGARDVEESASYARFAQDEGADCVCLPAAVGETGDAAQVVADLARVAASVSVAAMLQDAPAYLGFHLSPEAIGEITDRAPNVGQLKIEGGPRALEHARTQLGDGFALWGGDGGLHLLDGVRSGAVGTMPGPEVTDLLVAVHRAEAAGDSDGADRLARGVLPLICNMMQSLPHYVACAKSLLVRRGVLECAATRQRGATLTATSTRLLERHLGVAGL